VRRLSGHLRKYWLIYLGLAIYLLFFVSVAWTGWFDIFFSGAALHVGAKGIDFYQLPRGAWAFVHGGSLEGNHQPPGSPFTDQYFSNGNVYHPLFTITLGWLLTLADPVHSPYLWLWLKLFLSLLVIGYFYRSFRASKYVNFAVFLMLANFSIYLELAAWQFQFVLNILLLLFLIELVKRRSALWASVLYWLGMLVKPVGLLFVPALLFKRRWYIALIGIWLLVMSTLPFAVQHMGAYYTKNLINNLTQSGTVGPNQIITLSALLHYTTHWPDAVYQGIQDGFLLIVIFLSALRRTHIVKAVFLSIVYYLLFYQAVYEYQWSTLAYVLAVCVVICPEFQTRTARVCLLLTCLPDCFLLLARLRIDVKDLGYLGLIPGTTAWIWMTISKVVPLLLLLICVLAGDVVPIFRQMKALWKRVCAVNRELGIFGEQPELEGEHPESEAEALAACEETPPLESLA
jgi:hypothetical protein